MKIYFLIFLAVFLFAGSATGQQKFEPTINSRRDAIKKGSVNEFLSAMETISSEAEAMKDWERASMAYSEASWVSRSLGQLQKALTHAQKAIETSDRTRNPVLQLNANMWMGYAYADLGQPEKEREWLKKCVEIVKQIQGSKEFFEGRIYRQLGQNYLLQNETQQAIEYIAHSVQVFESLVSSLQRNRVYNPRPRQQIDQIEPFIVTGLRLLGTAYLQAGNPQEAIKAFERGMVIFTTSALKSTEDAWLMARLGRAYFAQGNFPRAEGLEKNGTSY